MVNQPRREPQQALPEHRVRSLLAAAAAPSEPGPAPGEQEALAAFRAADPDISRRSRMLSSLHPSKAAAAAVLSAGLLLTGGVAAAATGVLAGAAQGTASEMLAKVGVTVPGADEHSAGHADHRGSSEDQVGTPDETADTQAETDADAGTEAEAGTDTDAVGDAVNDGKGATVSELARTTESTGVEKGAEISGLASEGNSQAGEHGADDANRADDAAETGDDADTDTDADESDDSGDAGAADDAGSDPGAAGAENRR